MVIWAIVIVALAFVGWRMLRPPLPEDLASPEGTLRNYTEFVRPMIPPGSLSPTQIHVDQWLDYFDGEFRDWFQASAGKLAFLSMRNAETWKAASENEKRMEAMKYLLTQGAFRGGSPAGTSEQGDVTWVDVQAASARYRLPMGKSGRRWVFTQRLGQGEQLDQMTSGVATP